MIFLYLITANIIYFTLYYLFFNIFTTIFEIKKPDRMYYRAE
jgi:hypothetical protein